MTKLKAAVELNGHNGVVIAGPKKIGNDKEDRYVVRVGTETVAIKDANMVEILG